MAVVDGRREVRCRCELFPAGRGMARECEESLCVLRARTEQMSNVISNTLGGGGSQPYLFAMLARLRGKAYDLAAPAGGSLRWLEFWHVVCGEADRVRDWPAAHRACRDI